MGKKLSNHLDDLSEDAKDVLLKSIEYYKLDLFKKLALSLVSGGQFILKIGILILILFFVSIGFSFLIGNALGDVACGFFIVGGFYILLLILISIFGKNLLEKPVLNFLYHLLNSEKNQDKELKEELEQRENIES